MQEYSWRGKLSRGISVQEVKGRWSEGPEFLRLPEELWPQPSAVQASPEEHMERRRVEAVCQVKIAENPIDPQAFSSWRGWRKTGQSDCVLRHETPRPAPEYTLDITLDNATHASIRPSRSGYYNRQDKTTVLDPEGQQAEQIGEISLRYLQRNGA